MSWAPLIGLTTTLPSQPSSGELADQIRAYVQAIESAGGLPVLIPFGLPVATLRSLYERVDGLLLAGGGDVSPERYGESTLARLRSLDPDRDETELQVAAWAAAEAKPLLAICRGLQVINVAAGGSLYQDLPSQHPGPILHDPEDQPSETTVHPVEVPGGTLLSNMVQRAELDVNSAHHQAIRRLGTDLRIAAVAPEGVIEAAEAEGHPFYVGVQWHPERAPEQVESSALFSGLIAAARSERG